MHYAHFKQSDPRALKALVEAFPFAIISVNGPHGPMVAHAPLTFRSGSSINGTVEFHLAKANPILNALQDGAAATITINGPSTPISPSWYTARFPAHADRSRTAPTYNYVSATLHGNLQTLPTEALSQQIRSLVAQNEPENGWKMDEIDPETFGQWRNLIAGFRLPIEQFDLTAKLSQEQKPEDKPGIIAGLKERGTPSDIAMATLLEHFDGSTESLIHGLQIISPQAQGKNR